MSEVSIDAVGRTMSVLLQHIGRPLFYRDPANGGRVSLDVETAASPTGFLPVLVVAGETIWREATGKGFGLDIVRDSGALLGYRLSGIGAGSFATVMLSSLEAINQVARPEAVFVSELKELSTAASDRILRESVPEPQGSVGPGP